LIGRFLQRLPLVLSALMLVAIVQKATHGHRRREPAREQKAQPVKLDLKAPSGAHPRVLLDAAAIDRIKDAAKKRTPAWSRVQSRCDKDLSETIRSGYEAFDWGDAVAELALCWRGTGDKKYAERAARYLEAILDDRYLVGDKQGGDLVVRHDDGYGIRSFGVYAALGYDWLHDAPGMTPALRDKAIARLTAWLAWYREKGYQRDHSIANYFCGYLAAETFAALAMAGEAPVADAWFTHARDTLLGGLLIPEYTTTLKGGDWPEGWQYGELSAAEVALVVAALRTATGTDLEPKIPWLREVVTHHMHALVPGSSAVYDNGDWSEHPTKPSAVALTALPLALEPHDPDAAAQARWMTRNGLPDFGSEHLWLPLLAERVGGKEIDPHPGAPLSYHAAGTGLSFMRSEWTPRAVWASFQAGPTVADHQHNDQGHFELFRGGDGLLVDGGTYGSAATMSHNSILVDDGAKHLNYPPNQGTWGRAMRTTRFYDDGAAVVVAGDLTDAYLPACVEDGCSFRSVRAALRTMVYVRPATLVIDDRVTVDEGGFGVTWAAHVPVAAPRIDGTAASAIVGGSRVDVRTLLPADAKLSSRKEPTRIGDGPYRQNDPWGPMWRLEVESPRGATARRFLHAITAGAASDSAPAATRLEAPGLSGVELAGPGRDDSVLFADRDARGRVEASQANRSVVVAGLPPGTRYRITSANLGARCAIELIPDGAGPLEANAGGFVRAFTPGCAKR
jgi:hypothetical protein